MKVLSLNTGYFLGYDGRKQKYLRYPWRGVIGSKKVEEQKLQNLADRIEESEPDLIGLIEVDQGSIRTFTDGQLSYLVKELSSRGLDYRKKAGFKYRDNAILRNLPVIRGMCNGFLYKDGFDVEVHRLENGWKRTVLEARKGDLSVFLCHLPLTFFKDTQQHQLEAISELAAERDKFVICGDFNIDEISDLDILKNKNNAEIHSPGKTYPLYNPRGRYDLFILGPELRMKDIEIPDLDISDHLAVRSILDI